MRYRGGRWFKPIQVVAVFSICWRIDPSSTESKTVSAPYLVSMHASASQKHNIASTKCRGSVTWRRNLQETKSSLSYRCWKLLDLACYIRTISPLCHCRQLVVQSVAHPCAIGEVGGSNPSRLWRFFQYADASILLQLKVRPFRHLTLCQCMHPHHKNTT